MFGLTTTRRMRAELAAANAQTDRQRSRADRAEERAVTAEFNREQVLRQLAGADAANRRLNGRLLELGRRLAACAEADPEYAARLERRVARLRQVGKRILGAYTAQKNRADLLQAGTGLDDLDAIEAWEKAIAAHDAWKPAADDVPVFVGGRSRPTHPALILQRALERCRALEARLAVAEGRTRKAVSS